MKIICDSCGAKYSIADEKVAGKVFKIRCKKCSSMIVVRGDQEASASGAAVEAAGLSTGSASAAAFQQPAELGGYDASQEAVWHVVVAGDQQGPYAPVQLGEMLTVGTIDWEAYVWREGFDGWVPARDVPELVTAITGQPYDGGAGGFGEATRDAAGTAVAASPFASGFGDDSLEADPFAGNAAAFGGDHDSEDATSVASKEEMDALTSGLSDFGGNAPAARQSSPFAADSDFGGGAVAQRAASRNAGADLFGESDSGGGVFGGAAPFGGQAPTTMPDQQHMTGQRNESSVLFSLSNLQALAGESGGGGSAPPKAGHAAGEGSGLIDIRALAAATGRGGAANAGGGGGMFSAPSSKSAEDRIDDLMSIGTGSPLAMGNLGAPVLAPVASESSGNRGLIMALGGFAGVLVLVVIFGGFYLYNSKNAPVTEEAQQITPGTGGGIAPATTAAGAAPTNAANPAAPNPSGTPSAATGTGVAASDAAGKDQPNRPRRANAGGGRNDGPAKAAETKAAEPAPAPARRTGSGSIDDLLDNAIGGAGAKPAREAAEAPARSASDESLPDVPPRDAVMAALRSVESAVKACGGGKHGVATTKVTVSGSTGRVSSADVSGPFQGTPEGSCIARAVRGARFPRFKRDNMSVNFPYAL